VIGLRSVIGGKVSHPASKSRALKVKQEKMVFVRRFKLFIYD